MTKGEYIEPSITETRFSCPYCGTLTVQHWHYLYADKATDSDGKRLVPNIGRKGTLEQSFTLEDMTISSNSKKISMPFTERHISAAKLINLTVSVCDQCKEAAIWHRDRLMYPAVSTCPPAHEDMPKHIVTDYNEARTIIDLSARGAAALARLCVEKLCIHLLGEDVGSIDKAIGLLVEKDLDERIQKKLDIVRVNGSTLVHGGTMEDEDDRKKAAYLLNLVNLIVEEAITRPKRLDEEYDKLPPKKLKGIEDRPKRIASKKPPS